VKTELGKSKELPLKKEDIHYDSTTGEVSMKREKFDRLMQFLRDTMEQAHGAENARDTARARQRRAETGGVASAYASIVDEANRSVVAWLDLNPIQELSRRTGIPYATCHRIVNERLPKAQVDVETLGRILRAVNPSEKAASAGAAKRTSSRTAARAANTAAVR
jgi:hypothetical protein